MVVGWETFSNLGVGTQISVAVGISTLLFVVSDFFINHVLEERSEVKVVEAQYSNSIFDGISHDATHQLKIINEGSRPAIVVCHRIKKVNLVDSDTGRTVRATLESFSNPTTYDRLKQGKTVPAEYIGYFRASSNVDFKKPRGARISYDQIQVLLEFQIEDHHREYCVEYWDTIERGYF